MKIRPVVADVFDADSKRHKTKLIVAVRKIC
jgi:hypothetical protein